MPRIKLTKSAIDALPTPLSDVVYWDAAYPGFGVKITPKGRKVFIVLYRTGGAGSCLRKYTIGPTQRPVAAPFLQRVIPARGRVPSWTLSPVPHSSSCRACVPTLANVIVVGVGFRIGETSWLQEIVSWVCRAFFWPLA